MKNIITAVFVLIFSAILLCYIFVPLIYYDLNNQAEDTTYSGVFYRIALSSIQISRGFSAGHPDFLNNRSSFSEDFLKNPNLIDCSSKISTLDEDPRTSNSVDSFIISKNPIEVVLVYNGIIPNFDLFLNVISVPKEMKALQEFSTDTKMLEGQFYENLSEDYKNIVLGKTFRWRSQMCEKFSFTVIQEIDHG